MEEKMLMCVIDNDVDGAQYWLNQLVDVNKKVALIKLECSEIPDGCPYKKLVELSKKYGNKYHCSFLFIACYCGYLEIVKLLLKSSNIIVDSYKDATQRPIWGAYKNNQLEAVNLLIQDKRVNIHLGGGILYAACKNNHMEVVKSMLKHQNLNEHQYYKYNSDKRSLLYIACKRGNLELVKLLLSKNIGLDLNYGFSPLYFACENGHLEIVRLLLEKGIDVNQPKEIGSLYYKECLEKKIPIVTPLFGACIKGHNEIVKLLLEQKDIQTNKFYTKHNIPKKKFFCTDYTQQYFITPLFYACFEANFEVVKLLVEYSKNHPYSYEEKEVIEDYFIIRFPELRKLWSELK